MSPDKSNSAAPKLNEAIVKALPVPVAGNKVHYFPGAILQGKEVPRGFGVRITAAGVIAFVMNYRIKLRERRYTIGQYPDWTVLAAVNEARALRQRIDRGEDPLEDRDGISKDSTLKAITEEYFKRTCGMLRADDGTVTFAGGIRSAKLRLRAFERWVFPTLGSKQIADVKRSDISDLLKMIKDHKEGGPSIAHSVLAFVSKLMNWYAVNGGNDSFVSPIARGMSPIKPKERAGERTLADDEIRDLWTVLDEAERGKVKDVPPCFARLVKTLLLTALRRDEAARASWPEFDWIDRADFAGSVLTVPAARMKGKRDHAAPLTPTIHKLLGDRPKQEDLKSHPYIFSTDYGATPCTGYSKGKAALDKAIAAVRKKAGRDPVPPWQLSRDLRRTAKTLMQRAGVRPDISERVLAHVIPGVEGIYDRHAYLKEKLDALTRLGALVERLASGRIEW
jgi:integrase